MKKISLLLLFGIALCLSSCNKNTDIEYGILTILPITSVPHYIYADQTVDSAEIVSSSSWTASTTSSWMTMNSADMTCTVQAGTIQYKTVPIYYTANTTGTVRYSTLKVTNGEKTVGRQDMQTYWLNITNPGVIFTDPETMTGPSFTLSVEGTTTSANISFTTYSSNATLTTTSDWVQLGQSQFSAGSHTVAFTLSSNTTGASRTANIVLTSSGISNTIQLIQLPS